MSEELKRRAEEIRNETARNGNTAERVGGVLVDMAGELDEVRKRLDEFMGFTYIDRVDFPTNGGVVKLGVKTNCEWGVE